MVALKNQGKGKGGRRKQPNKNSNENMGKPIFQANKRINMNLTPRCICEDPLNKLNNSSPIHRRIFIGIHP